MAKDSRALVDTSFISVSWLTTTGFSVIISIARMLSLSSKSFSPPMLPDSMSQLLILCCATVNDDKLEQATGYGHSLKPVFLIASLLSAVTIRLSHQMKLSTMTIRLDALDVASAPHN
jgi:hypothetical protein